MKSITRQSACAAASLVLLAAAAPVCAQSSAVSSNPAVYPAKGQSARQMDKDKYECHAWAKGQTGYDPAQAPMAPSQAQGSATGAAKGALRGAAIGELAHDDPGHGAAAGILATGVRERVKHQRGAQQQQAARTQQQANYQRAFGACLQGRGYAVK